jgi:ABC-type transport system involved in multi-copper enzyme maturation permease subunit
MTAPWRLRVHEWLGIAAGCAGTAVLLGPGEDWTGWQQLAGWLVLALIALLATQRFWSDLLGPVLWWELVRQARKGRMLTLRVAYLGVLLTILAFLFLATFGRHGGTLRMFQTQETTTLREMAAFARTFFVTFLGIQLGAVVLLTPALTGGAVAEEKERRTLDFLLVTHLSDVGIILGKLVARLGGLFLLLLGGLPVLAFLQLLGGVDPHFVLGGYAVTLLTMLGVGSVGILQSTQAPHPRTAIFRTYLLVVGYLACTSLFCVPAMASSSFRATYPGAERIILFPAAGSPVYAMVRVVEGLGLGQTPEKFLPPVLLDYALFHGLLTVGCLYAAARSLRQPDVQPRQAALRETVPATESQPIHQAWRPSVWEDDPMLWKEFHLEKKLTVDPFMGFFVYPTVVLLASLALFGLLCSLIIGLSMGDLGRLMKSWLMWVLIPIACLDALAVAVRAAGAFASERERQTLDNLLTTDLSVTEIVWAKWLGSLLHPTSLWIIGLGAVFLGLATTGLLPTAFPLTIAALIVPCALAASLGLACSLSASNSWRATVQTLLLLGLLLVGHWGIFGFVRMFFDLSYHTQALLAELHAVVLTPPLTLLYAIEGTDLLPVVIGLLLQGLVALLLYWHVRARFARLVGR